MPLKISSVGATRSWKYRWRILQVRKRLVHDRAGLVTQEWRSLQLHIAFGLLLDVLFDLRVCPVVVRVVVVLVLVVVVVEVVVVVVVVVLVAS